MGLVRGEGGGGGLAGGSGGGLPVPGLLWRAGGGVMSFLGLGLGLEGRGVCIIYKYIRR